MNMRSRPIRLPALACCCAALLLAACSGKDNDKDNPAPPEVINGITVPPDPGAAAAATLQGIDVNANGVRDEVERALAHSYGSEAPLYAAAMKTAVFDQKWLSLPATLTAEKAQALVSAALRQRTCLLKATGVENGRIISQEVELRTFNTQGRMAEHERLFDAAGAFEVPAAAEEVC